MKAELLEPRRLMAAGDIDLAFGNNGLVEAPDLIVSFNSQTIAPAGGDKYFLFRPNSMQRVDASGTPDATFGGNDGATLFVEQPRDATVLPGEILVRGDSDLSTVQNGPNGVGVLEKLNADGSPDTSFGQGGEITSTSIDYELLGMQSSGKIVVVESDLDPTTDVGLPRSTLRRLNSDGSDDNTFTPFSFVREGTAALAVLPGSDKILLGGAIGDDNTHAYDSRDSIVMRFNADGSVDTSFGTNGRVPREVDQATGNFFDANALALVPGGNGSFIAGDSNAGAEMKFNSDGSHDATFQTPGGNGRSDTSSIASVPVHLIAQPDGKFIVYDEGGMTRLNADGTIDATFGRILTSDSDSLKIRGAVLTASGDILTAVNRLIPFEGEFTGLTRLQGAGSTPGPVTLVGSTLTVTGTEDADDITIGTVFHYPDPVHDIQVHFAGRMDRLIDLSAVTALSVQALGGDDVVRAYLDVPQSVSGGDGNDGIIGGPGNDSLSGNAGRDHLEGGGGNDRLAGNGGHDKLSGGDGDDLLLGGAGPDGLAGEAGNDILKGDDGDDVLIGGDGIDTFAGGNGDDQFFAQDSQPESLFGDAGNDSAAHDANDVLNGIENDITG